MISDCLDLVRTRSIFIGKKFEVCSRAPVLAPSSNCERCSHCCTFLGGADYACIDLTIIERVLHMDTFVFV